MRVILSHVAYNKNTEWLSAHTSTDGTDNPGKPRLISHSMVKARMLRFSLRGVGGHWWTETAWLLATGRNQS